MASQRRARAASTHALRFFAVTGSLRYGDQMSTDAPARWLRVLLRPLPGVAVLLAVFVVAREPDLAHALLAAVLVLVASALELHGWSRAIRRTPRALAVAALSGGVVLGGLWSAWDGSFDDAPPRIARR